jgi:ubiquinone/menaquinone biosynthesis C-methylase UbiE
LIALDASPHACRLARKQLRDGSTADILVADARAIPLTPGSVDAVIAHHITGHLLQQDRLALVNETTRVLKQGGLFLFCDFSIDDFRCGNGSEIEEMTYRRGNGIITHYFTEEEVRAFSPLLILKEIRSHRGSLRVRGENHPRAEIIACFTRV